jgi:hypothetical protein
MFRAVLVTVGAAKLADRRFLILRRAIGVPALLAEHLPQVIVDTVVSPLAVRAAEPGIRVPASDRDCLSFTGVNETRRPCVSPGPIPRYQVRARLR